MALRKIDQGRVYEDSELAEQLEAIGFSREEDGSFSLKRTALERRRGRPGVKVFLREKAKEKRIYTYANIDASAGGGGLVYAPDRYSAAQVVREVRDWMTRHNLL
jgi:hypothetical protein